MSQDVLTINNLNDIILNAKNGDEYAYLYLIDLFKPSILGICKKYFLPKGEKEDLYQVCLIGLYQGVLNFKLENSSNPIHFLKTCIKREVIDLLKAANRQKHTAINTSISIETTLSTKDDKTFTLGDTLTTNSDFVDNIILEQEYIRNIKDNINKLTDMQKNIFSLYLNGFSQREISNILGLTGKQVDNALQRAKKRMYCLLVEQ